MTSDTSRRSSIHCDEITGGLEGPDVKVGDVDSGGAGRRDRAVAYRMESETSPAG
jgi:hypothetical protein